MKPTRIIALGIFTTGVCAAMMVLTLELSREGRGEKPQMPAPETPASPAEVRIKAVERKVQLVERKAEPTERGEAALASGAVAIVCGMDEATADRYEARNDALRSIARRRDLAKKDVEALLAYLGGADDAMRVERVAALKNDVMNLLRNQEPPVEGLAETLVWMVEGRPVAGFGRSGRAGVPPPAADGDGTPSLPARSRDTDGDGTPSLPGNTIHPPAVIDYCIQHLGAMVNELDDAARVGARGAPALPNGGVRGVLVRAASDKMRPYAGTALYSLAEDKRATREQEGEFRRLTLALCRPGAHNVARIAAIQLAGQRGYAEALPVLRDTLSGEKRDAVLDTVCIGSIGLLGNADDIALMERFAGDVRRAAAVEAAIKRIKERENVGTPTAGNGASLTLRHLLRAVQPHEIRSDSFGGLGAVSPDKENIVGGNNRGFVTRSQSEVVTELSFQTVGVLKSSTRFYTFYTAKLKT